MVGEQFAVDGDARDTALVTPAEAIAWLDGHVNLETGVGFTRDASSGAHRRSIASGS